MEGMDVGHIYLYISDDPAPFSATPGGASLKRWLSLIVHQKNPGPALMAQPCPASLIVYQVRTHERHIAK
jgi:hypothetical protein